MSDLDSHLKAIRFAAVMCEGSYVPNGTGEIAVSDLLLEAGAEIERLRKELTAARDALRNDFEPDNQSRAWHRANNALQ